MSVAYTSILWNKQKKRYDLALAGFVIAFVALFFSLHSIFHPTLTFETVFIRAFGWLALLLLHVILVIGPLSRFNRHFLIVLYNRRHLGVTMFLMGLLHGGFSVMNFHSLGDTNPIKSVFLSNLRYNSIEFFPFQTLGFLALVVLALMAASSHDFWLKNLGIKAWKGLHMLVYVAYGLLLMHVILGALQNETSPFIYDFVLFGFLVVASLHIASAFKERKADRPILNEKKLDFVYACDVDEIPEDEAKIVTVSGERVAIFKYDSKISAVGNVCRHQGGPLGEGKIIDGCITCPWHGYQYLPENGQSPPPFTEKTETYHLKLEEGQIFINTEANEPGTPVTPLSID